MRTVFLLPTFAAWRNQARTLLAQGIKPDEILWCDDAAEGALFAVEENLEAKGGPAPKVPAAFLDLARAASVHTDPQRWAILYRLLWRLTLGGERQLLSVPTDGDVRQMQLWCKAVGRDIHKMHAFVRFRFVGTDATTGREQFVAWFEPAYPIIRLATPFFQKRFTGMDWSILTPYECGHWNGVRLHFTPGLPRRAPPDDDALENLWRSYYRSSFNPARLKLKAMQSEMPKKYWKNLPEARLIGPLIAGSQARMQHLLEAEERPAKPAPVNAYLEKIRRLNATDSEAPPQ